MVTTSSSPSVEGAAADVQFAEETSERLLLVKGHLLVAEEDDLMLDQRVVDFLESLIAERLGQINTRDLRPDDGLNGQRICVRRSWVGLHNDGRIKPRTLRR